MTPNEAMRCADRDLAIRGDDKTLADCLKKAPLPPEIPATPVAERGPASEGGGA